MHRWMIGLSAAAIGFGLGGAARACDNSIQPIGGSDGYQNRSQNRCEGLYESPVSGPPLELVSLTWGSFPKEGSPGQKNLLITTQGNRPGVHVRAEGIPAGLYYRMDGTTEAKHSDIGLDWPLQVIDELHLDLSMIGILAFRDETDGDTVFVPAAVDDQAKAAPQVVAEIRPLVPIDSLSWRVLGGADADPPWNDADPQGDRFVINIPRSAVSGRTLLEVRWDDPASGQAESKEFPIRP